MLIILTVSARRHLVVDADRNESGWRHAGDVAPAHGIALAGAKLVTPKPVSYEAAIKAAAAYAAEKGMLITNDEWRQRQAQKGKA